MGNFNFVHRKLQRKGVSIRKPVNSFLQSRHCDYAMVTMKKACPVENCWNISIGKKGIDKFRLETGSLESSSENNIAGIILFFVYSIIVGNSILFKMDYLTWSELLILFCLKVISRCLYNRNAIVQLWDGMYFFSTFEVCLHLFNVKQLFFKEFAIFFNSNELNTFLLLD